MLFVPVVGASAGSDGDVKQAIYIVLNTRHERANSGHAGDGRCFAS